VTDKLTPEKRSWNMSRIKGQNTAPELAVRKVLHKAGYRFRLHRKDLPGRPDIVLPKYKTVIFVHGCFWHSHGCKDSGTPKTNTGFWSGKLADNVCRDTRNQTLLKQQGWNVQVIWECEIRDTATLLCGLNFGSCQRSCRVISSSKFQ
jgi:DNA mismatch endonuclease (patch repair protein)